MMILDEKDGGDSELLVYAMTLVNKVSGPLIGKSCPILMIKFSTC